VEAAGFGFRLGLGGMLAGCGAWCHENTVCDDVEKGAVREKEKEPSEDNLRGDVSEKFPDIEASYVLSFLSQTIYSF
jgi:hypothetical protein